MGKAGRDILEKTPAVIAAKGGLTPCIILLPLYNFIGTTTLGIT